MKDIVGYVLMSLSLLSASLGVWDLAYQQTRYKVIWIMPHIGNRFDQYDIELKHGHKLITGTCMSPIYAQKTVCKQRYIVGKRYDFIRVDSDSPPPILVPLRDLDVQILVWKEQEIK